MEKIYRLIFIACMVCVGSGRLYAGEVYSESFLWGLNLVETWVLADIDAEAGIVSFSDMEGQAIFQIIVTSPDAYSPGNSHAQAVRQMLGAQGDMSAFTFNGHHAELADLSWTAGTRAVRGYVVTIDNAPDGEHSNSYPHDYALVSFSAEDKYELYSDFLLSNLDGFSPRIDEYHAPGVVSQFLRSTGGAEVRGFPLAALENPLPSRSPDQYSPLAALPLDGGEEADIEAAYATIEREARILNQFTQAPAEIKAMAWRRYYQMLYKDSWYDMRSLAETIAGRFEGHGLSRSEYAGELLSWIQGFAYRRTGGLSDLEPAWGCLNNGEGDCDRLGLVYMALLDPIGINSVLMVSQKHGHSLVGVDVGGPGARFPFLDTRWLVAELTADVSLGMIAAEHADPADWVAFDMDFHPEW